MEINKDHYLEVTDRAHTICLMISELLAEHPLVLETPELQEVVVQLENAAYRVYSDAATLMVDDE